MVTTANLPLPWNLRGLSESDSQHMYLQQHKQCSLLIPPYHQSSCTHIHLLMCALVCNSCHKLMHLVVTAPSYRCICMYLYFCICPSSSSHLGLPAFRSFFITIAHLRSAALRAAAPNTCKQCRDIENESASRIGKMTSS